jgi:hypothetical protein
VETIIIIWCTWWLSLGGTLTLVKSMLEAIPIHWHSAYIPTAILEKIHKHKDGLPLSLEGK